MANAPENDVRTTTSTGPRRTGRTMLTLPARAVLVLGLATLLAGCYRAAVEHSDGRLRALVPVAVGAPLAAELLLLVAGIVLAAAVLLTAAARSQRS